MCPRRRLTLRIVKSYREIFFVKLSQFESFYVLFVTRHRRSARVSCTGIVIVEA